MISDFIKRDAYKIIVSSSGNSPPHQAHCTKKPAGFYATGRIALIPVLFCNGYRKKDRHENLNCRFFYACYPAHTVVLLAVKEILRTY